MCSRSVSGVDVDPDLVHMEMQDTSGGTVMFHLLTYHLYILFMSPLIWSHNHSEIEGQKCINFNGIATIGGFAHRGKVNAWDFLVESNFGRLCHTN